jgi:hypothetical protein
MPTLDEELSRAASDLHDHVAKLEIPPFRSRRRPAALTAAAAGFIVVAFAGVIALALNDGSVTQETVGQTPAQQLRTTGDYALPDGRALLVQMTPDENAGSSGSEFCVGSDIEVLCVTGNGEQRVAWNITRTTDDVCANGGSLLYGITTLPAAEVMEYKTTTDEGQPLTASDVVHPRVVPIPQSALDGPDTAAVGDMVDTFASCVPTHPTGTVTLLGGYSQDLGSNVSIASDVPITPTRPTN